jgi:signal peptidase I
MQRTSRAAFGRARMVLYGCGAALALFQLVSPIRLGIALGESMTPTFRSGSPYLIDLRSLNQPPKRGDVIVFSQEGQTYIKRVVALGGDTVYLLRQQGESGGEMIQEPVLRRLRRVLQRSPWKTGLSLVEHRVPEGECWVVGDNLQLSRDSRHFGTVPLSAVQGRVLFAPPPEREIRQLAVSFAPASS